MKQNPFLDKSRHKRLMQVLGISLLVVLVPFLLSIVFNLWFTMLVLAALLYLEWLYKVDFGWHKKESLGVGIIIVAFIINITINIETLFSGFMPQILDGYLWVFNYLTNAG